MTPEKRQQIEMIGDFMQVQIKTRTDGTISYRPDKYWESLMPVIEKMITMYDSQFLFEVPGYLNIDDKHKFHFEALSDCNCCSSGEGSTLIEAAFNGVVQFVEYYNKNKK